jgi:hypothetical protein
MGHARPGSWSASKNGNPTGGDELLAIRLTKTPASSSPARNLGRPMTGTKTAFMPDRHWRNRRPVRRLFNLIPCQSAKFVLPKCAVVPV